MNLLVLGSHGCIGTAVCKFLKEKGHTVIPWDIKMGPDYDLRIPGNIDSILSTVDFVFFLAFDVGGSKYNIESLEYINNNVQIVMNTFTSLSKYNKPFIHTTSQMSNMNHNTYSVIKRLGELYTKQLGGINVKIWNVYGSEPINEKSHVIPDFIHQAIHSNEIQMKTTGEEERQFVFSEDFANGIYTIFKKYDEFKVLNNECIDISSYKWITITDVANSIQEVAKELLQKDIIIKKGSMVGTFQILKNEPALSKLNDLWTPTTTLKEGITSVFKTMV